MNGLTNLEAQIQSLLGFYTRKGYNGNVITESGVFTKLSSTSIPAQLVYISNTSGENLFVSTNNGDTYLSLPDGSIFPFNNISDLSFVSIRTESSSPGITITFRYEI